MPKMSSPYDVYDPKFDLNVIHKGQQKRRHITKIILHCSDSTWGDFKVIDDWHRQRKDSQGNPWKGIVFAGKHIVCGYHYIILNGHRSSGIAYVKADDGLIEKGRPDDFVGAHCRGQNLHSLGICLIGKTEFTDNQMRSLSSLITNLTARRDVLVRGHYTYSPIKTCPNFDVEDFMDKWESNYWECSRTSIASLKLR